MTDLLEWLKLEVLTLPNANRVVEQLKLSHIMLILLTRLQDTFWKAFGSFWWDTHLPWDPAVPLLAVYAREMKALFMFKPVHECV